MRRGLLAISALALVAAVLAAPRGSTGASGDRAAGALRVILGPLGAPVAGALRLRAGFARSEGSAMESIQLQEMALELDPFNTDAALRLANELAFDLPSAGATAASRRECGRLGVAALERARKLGNRSAMIADAEAFLLSERVAPRGDSMPGERAIVLDRAVELAELAASEWILAHARAAQLLTERGTLRYAQGAAREAAADFERAALHDRLLAERGDRAAAPLIRANDARRRICEIDAGENDAAARDAALRELSEIAPDDPFAAEARRRR